MAHIREALRLDPNSSDALTHLARSLEEQGRPDEALAEGLKILRLNSRGGAANPGVHSLLLRVGGAPELRLAWQKALAANPPDHNAWFGYAELCLFLGDVDEYRRARCDLLARFGASTDHYVAERTGRACLLLPASEDELRQAAALTDRAVAARGSDKSSGPRPYALFAKGLAEYRLGRHESAIALMEQCAAGVKGPAARFVEAMARHRSGQTAGARKALATAVLSFDWSAAKADSRDPAWIAHILRREAEAMILPDLPAFLQGNYQPRDNDERLALLGVCQFKDLRGAEAGLYAAAFSADPRLAEVLATGLRYPAVRAAAAAGDGRGADAAKLGAEERNRWHRQARDWLRAEVALWRRTLDDGPPADRVLVRDRLTHLWADPDLARLLHPEVLYERPSAERRSLRGEVDDLIRRAQTIE